MESQGLGKAFHGGGHYENFPVGSWLVPKPMRSGVLALYRFARTGDDLADEGGLSIDERLAGLAALEDGLVNRHCEEPEGRHGNLTMTREIGTALREALDAYDIPIAPALALLSAFRQDVHNPILQTEDEVLHYCSRSANPIGQLVLAFAGLVDLNAGENELIEKSNAICTGLQLANFAQDMGQDFSRGRIYVPQSWDGSPRPFGARDDERHIAPRDDNTHPSLRGPEGPVAIQLVTKMARWAQDFLARGEGLPARIRRHPSHASFRLALEIALTLEGGKAICKKVLANPGAVWQRSPTITKKELPVILLRSLFSI